MHKSQKVKVITFVGRTKKTKQMVELHRCMFYLVSEAPGTVMTLQTIRNLAFLFLAFSLCGCPYKEVDLPGHISGTVIDADTQEPIQDAVVKLLRTNDSIKTTTTGMDGRFLFTNLEESIYTIGLYKELYKSHIDACTVYSTNTSDLEITLRGKPEPEFSTSTLHFGLESTQLSFSIGNSGRGILSYDIIPIQDWISVDPESGAITEESKVIEVNIHKEGLQEVSHQAWILIRSDILGEEKIDTIFVYVNYVMDEDSTIYKTVMIGNQVWMAENLNTGTTVEAHGDNPSSNNGSIEKLCYGNNLQNCEIYGGLYMWQEAMDYAEADTEGIRTTKGVCPDGWHIPTAKEFEILIEFLGTDKAGGMLKDTSALWSPPNSGAGNETGFTALPAGAYYSNTYLGPGEFRSLGDFTWFWSTWRDSESWKVYRLSHLEKLLSARSLDRSTYYPNAMSVRCIKDP